MATMASVASVEAGAPKKQSYFPPRPRRFLPLKKGKDGGSDGVRLRGVVFDVDGTLCLPQNYMFQQMRDALQIPKSVDIIDHIQSLSGEPDKHDSDSNSDTQSSPQSRAKEAIRSIERNAMTSQKPQPGLVELMTYLESKSIHKGLCTRNFLTPVEHLISEFLTPHGVHFQEPEIITRETMGIKPKPSPEGIWSIGKYWFAQDGAEKQNIEEKKADGADEDDVLDVARKYLGSELIMVGDSIDDMAAGYRAGAATVLLVNEYNEDLAEHEYTDLAIKRLDDLVSVLEEGFVGNASL